MQTPIESTRPTGFDLAGKVRRNPYQTLLVAAGVGYILGGGLFTRFTLNAVRLGVRAAGIPIVQRELLGVAAAALGARNLSPA